MKATIWSKEICPYCIQAKKLLEFKGVEYQEKKIGADYTKEDLLEEIPTARSVPQIIIDDQVIGGYTELKKYFGV